MKKYEIADTLGKTRLIEHVTHYERGTVRTLFFRGNEVVFDIASFSIDSLRLVEETNVSEYQRGWRDAINAMGGHLNNLSRAF